MWGTRGTRRRNCFVPTGLRTFAAFSNGIGYSRRTTPILRNALRTARSPGFPGPGRYMGEDLPGERARRRPGRGCPEASHHPPAPPRGPRDRAPRRRGRPRAAGAGAPHGPDAGLGGNGSRGRRAGGEAATAEPRGETWRSPASKGTPSGSAWRLCRKHQVRAGKEARFPAMRLWQDYGLTRLGPRTASLPWAKA